MTVASCFDLMASTYPDKIAIVSQDRTITYRGLAAAAAEIATRLTQSGVVRGQSVALLSYRSIEAIAAMLGILKAGAAFVPLDAAYPREVLRYIHQDSGARLTLVQRERAAEAIIFKDQEVVWLDPLGDGVPTVPTACETTHVASPGDTHGDPDDIAYIMYTSGSTGRPKGVMVPHRAIMRLVVDCSFADLNDDTVVMHLAPLSFDASTFEIWGALLNGGTLVVVPSPHPSLDDIADVIQQNAVTTLWLTAGLFHLMVERRLDGLRPLRQLIAGGDVLSPPHVVKLLRALPGCRVINGYGPTENTTFTCCYTIPRDWRETDPLPIGYAIQDTTLHVVDDTLRPVPAGEAGELVVGGAGVALGYCNQPELTATKFLPDRTADRRGALLYRTGDLVRFRPDGALDFIGRLDRQIKISGKRVELDAVEAVLRRLPGVKDAAVIARADERGQRRMIAAITHVAPMADTPAILRMHMQASEPDYLVPSEIRILPVLPLSPTGKVDRARLAELVTAPATNGVAISAVSDSTEAVVASIVARVAGRASVGPNDNFFDIGLTSLQLTEVQALISERFPTRLAPTDLFAFPNVRDVARRIDGTATTRAASLSVQERNQRRAAAMARARTPQGSRSAS